MEEETQNKPQEPAVAPPSVPQSPEPTQESATEPVVSAPAEAPAIEPSVVPESVPTFRPEGGSRNPDQSIGTPIPETPPTPQPETQTASTVEADSSNPPEPEVQERVVAKTVPRELNEEEQTQMFHHRLKTLGVKAVAAKRKRLQDNLDTIIAHLQKSGFVTNNEVQKFCKVADSTATKYLKELEKLGLIIPIGRKGRGLRWRLKTAIP